MKAILEFNLPEDNHEFRLASNANDIHWVMWDMDQWLRGMTKHAPDDMSEDTYNALELCREKLHEIMNERNINFDI
tara:strand:- start:153 stop:380 length:228 start_codon:yes stop_codon:yes gene_type:complete